MLFPELPKTKVYLLMNCICLKICILKYIWGKVAPSIGTEDVSAWDKGLFIIFLLIRSGPIFTKHLQAKRVAHNSSIQEKILQIMVPNVGLLKPF